jgi:hypothetical protein
MYVPGSSDAEDCQIQIRAVPLGMHSMVHPAGRQGALGCPATIAVDMIGRAVQ